MELYIQCNFRAIRFIMLQTSDYAVGFGSSIISLYNTGAIGLRIQKKDSVVRRDVVDLKEGK